MFVPQRKALDCREPLLFGQQFVDERPGLSMGQRGSFVVGEDGLERVEVVALRELLERFSGSAAAQVAFQHFFQRGLAVPRQRRPLNTWRPTAWFAPKPPPTNTW